MEADEIAPGYAVLLMYLMLVSDGVVRLQDREGCVECSATFNSSK